MDADRFYDKVNRKLDLEKNMFWSNKETAKLRKRVDPRSNKRGRDDTPATLPWEDQSVKSPSYSTATKHSHMSTRELLDFMQHSLFPLDEPGPMPWEPTDLKTNPERLMRRQHSLADVKSEVESPVIPHFSRRRAASVTPMTALPVNASWRVNETRRLPRLVTAEYEGPLLQRSRNGPSREVQSDIVRKSMERPKTFENPREAPEPIKMEDTESEQLSRTVSARSTRSREKIKAWRYGWRARSVERSTRTRHESVERPRVQTDGLRSKRKDSLVDSPSPEHRTFHSKRCVRDEEGNSPSQITKGSDVRTLSPYSGPGYSETIKNETMAVGLKADGLMAAIQEIDSRCSAQADQYTSLIRQRCMLQKHIVSCLTSNQKEPKGKTQDRHNRLAEISEEMDRQVVAMLEEQRQKTAMVQSLISWNVGPGGELCGASRLHDRGSGRFTMSYDTVMKFLDQSAGDE